jgi:L-tyrosine isonitrile synthase
MSSRVACVGGSVAALSLAQEHNPHPVTAHYDQAAAGSKKAAASPSKQFRGRATTEQNVCASAEKVLRSFNTWAFKREQPSDPQLTLQVIAAAIAAQQPIQFALYWGKGPRHKVAAPDTQCLDFLATLTSRVQSAYEPGATIKLILTDTHAELNGHSLRDINKYFDDIDSAAKQRGFETCVMSQLAKAADNLATVAPLEGVVSADTVARLVASAKKWYRGSATPQEGAMTYLRMNLIEQSVVERAFPHSIFITFNGRNLRSLFPQKLPIFYMYSLRRGMCVKPWFLPVESTAFGVSVGQPNPRQPN